jgi:50S ribosomal protein L16 3-hydroxylase
MKNRISAGTQLGLLGELTPSQFMRRHWQREPLLVRGSQPSPTSPISRARLFSLAARADVESRLVARTPRGRWALRHGPFERGSLPALDEPRWTLLVQGVDLHDDAVHALLREFRFLPDARIDDVMISWASKGGGVGPHVDSYDVFLLQTRGRRRWRISKQRDVTLDDRAPLKILRRFTPTTEYVLRAGDLLYLPPGWAHEGEALDGDCVTCSIGMRAPQRGALAAEIAQRLAETATDPRLYRDLGQAATTTPAAIPRRLASFAAEATQQLLTDQRAVARALGEVLSEPKAHVWFRKNAARGRLGAVALDRQTRMLYDSQHVFINGEAVRVGGRDATLLRKLADERALDARPVRSASKAARALLAEWLSAGWLQSPARPQVARHRSPG